MRGRTTIAPAETFSWLKRKSIAGFLLFNHGRSLAPWVGQRLSKVKYFFEGILLLSVWRYQCYALRMPDEQERKPRFWPMLFLGAFASGAILWCLWMVVIVQKTRQIHPTDLYPPASQSSPSLPSNSQPVATNDSTGSTNSAPGGAK
jgi:hypothetical protein